MDTPQRRARRGEVALDPASFPCSEVLSWLVAMCVGVVQQNMLLDTYLLKSAWVFSPEACRWPRSLLEQTEEKVSKYM